MDRRRQPRIAARFSVHVWGVDAFSQPFVQLAQLKDISSSGAVVRGITHTVRAGELLEVQLEQEKAQFRVVWVGKAGSRKEGEVGLARLASEPCLLELNPSYSGAAVGKG